MESPIGSKIFNRYRHQQTQRHGEEDNRGSGSGGIDGIVVSPTREIDLTPKKAASNSRRTSVDRNRTDPNNDIQNIRMLDDLTMGYSESPSPRFTTERNPAEYALSPDSARSFRIMSLDRCREETVSPLFPDSSSSSISSFNFLNVPMMPGPIIPSLDADEEFPHFTKVTKTSDKLSTKVDTSSNDDTFEMKMTPVSKQTRRKNNHNRSNFVFDGNLSFGSVSSPTMFLPPPPMYISPITRVFLPDMSMTNNSFSAPVPITPPRALDIGFCNDDICHDRKQQWRKTPPPTHQEQRRRNRAMPSMQYENDILNRLRRQRQQEQQQLQHQNTW